ncbi:hypothetical protein [Paenibacillus pinihumi]|uniref:hypothetical protein n=1 Tax=Paenibacillus pinihumi TaxID=669462 RepID=UPI0004299F69|nr:hypothetical protein [Paenibacillus pinihumi]
MNKTSKRFKSQLLVRSMALGITLTVAAGAGAAAAAPLASTANVPAQTVTAQSSQAIYDQFQIYLKAPGKLSQARKYLLNHISKTSPHHATLMTLHLENAQRADLASFTKKFETGILDGVRVESPTFTNLLAVVKDPAKRKLLIEARDRGYQIATQEGMYYPVINYSEYKRYSPYVNRDIAAYIDIMAVEANKPALGDAALLISWDEALKRGLEREKFLDTYKVSNRRANVERELEFSKMHIFYGANNTPLFDYDTKTIEPGALKTYKKALENGAGSSKLLGTLQKFMDVLEKNGGKRTADVDKFLKANVPLKF